MTSTLPPVVQAISGSIGSVTANSLTYPLDLVTTRLQLQASNKPKGLRGALVILHKIIDKYGLLALYDGLPADSGATLLSNFFYFYIYSFLRKSVLHRQKSPFKLNVFQELALGFMAGIASRAISTPLNIVALRLQTEDSDDTIESQSQSRSAGFSSVVKRIYKEQGLPGFWSGITSVLLSLNPSITLAFFQLFRRVLVLTRSRHKAAPLDPTPREAFLGGAISNSIAIALLYPLILAKTRLQARQASGTSANLYSVLVNSYQGHETSGKQEPGIGGLYQGLEMQIIKGFISQGVTFLVKGRIEQLIVQAYLKRRRS